MTDNTLPEVGSRWTIKDVDEWVTAVKKRGRGYYVEFTHLSAADDGLPDVSLSRMRLADFRKQAKPAGDA